MRRMTIVAILAVAAMHARADTLADVKTAVRRLSAKEPAKATFTTEALVKATGKFDNDNTRRKATVEVAHYLSGVAISRGRPSRFCINVSCMDCESARTSSGDRMNRSYRFSRPPYHVSTPA